MNIILNDGDYSINNVYFTECTNDVLNINEIYYKILYSNNIITLNGIYILLNINNFNSKTAINNYLHNIEIDILNKINSKEFTYIYKLVDSFNRFYNKNIVLDNTENKYILKIFGIYESNNEYYLNFKFLNINQ
jgi:hypothetical protein